MMHRSAAACGLNFRSVGPCGYGLPQRLGQSRSIKASDSKSLPQSHPPYLTNRPASPSSQDPGVSNMLFASFVVAATLFEAG